MRHLSLVTFAFGMTCAACAQTVSVTADAGPDESMSRRFMQADDRCRSLVNQHASPKEAVAACKVVADQADAFASNSHYLVRRGAYVFYSMALMQAQQFADAVAAADKAVAVVRLNHDDADGVSAAYGTRAQARALAHDLEGADHDYDTAETVQRASLNTPAGMQLKGMYTSELNQLLFRHAQVLEALGRHGAAQIKLQQISTSAFPAKP